MPKPNTLSELDELRAKIAKERGNLMHSAANLPRVNHIPTGAFMLDFALLGGLAEGHNAMLYGYESSGKTFLAKKAVAGFHKKYPDKYAVWIDSEKLFDPDWAQMLGCDLNRLEVVNPETGNEAVDIIEAVMEPEEVGIVVLDSVPGCVPKRVAEKSAEDATMGELARLMGLMCSKVILSWARERKRDHYVTFLDTNQWRSKIGVMFGDPRTLPGGRQINHLPSTKIEVKNKEILGTDSLGGGGVIRNEHSFSLSKAKHGRSIREGEFHVSVIPESNDGIPAFEFINHKAVISTAKRMGILLGGGSGGYYFDGFADDFGRHRTYEAVGEYLIANQEAMEIIQRRLISMQRADKGLPPLPPDGYLVAPSRSVRRIRRS